MLGGWGYFSFGQKMIVVRFDANGDVDESFGTNGRTVLLRFGEIAGVETSDELGALAFVASGRIPVQALIAVLTTLNAQVKALQGQVEAHFGQHPAAEILRSQPGLGPVLDARVLAEFGDDGTTKTREVRSPRAAPGVSTRTLTPAAESASRQASTMESSCAGES